MVWAGPYPTFPWEWNGEGLKNLAQYLTIRTKIIIQHRLDLLWSSSPTAANRWDATKAHIKSPIFIVTAIVLICDLPYADLIISGVSLLTHSYIAPPLRCVVGWLCICRVASGSAHLPWRKRCGPTGGNNKGARHTFPRADSRHESRLSRVQVPANQSASLAQGGCPHPSSSFKRSTTKEVVCVAVLLKWSINSRISSESTSITSHPMLPLGIT